MAGVMISTGAWARGKSRDRGERAREGERAQNKTKINMLPNTEPASETRGP